MSRRKRFVVAGVVLALLLAPLLSPSARMAIDGWLRGEAFYRGMPTSYWRGPAKRWQRILEGAVRDSIPSPPVPPPGLLERLHGLVLGRKWVASDDLPPNLIDPAAVPVLRQLLHDEDADVREYARMALSWAPPDAGGVR